MARMYLEGSGLFFSGHPKLTNEIGELGLAKFQPLDNNLPWPLKFQHTLLLE